MLQSLQMKQRTALFLTAAAISGGLAAYVIIRRRQQQLARRAAFPRPDDLILDPNDPATVTRLPDGRLHLTWQRTDSPVKIYLGDTPDSINYRRRIAHADSDQQAIITGLDPNRRYFFGLVFPNGDKLVTAERNLPVPGVHNFRDIGGYATTTGHTIRWGQVYRAADFADLTPAGHAYLQHLGLKLICDLRTESETRRRPNQLPQFANHTPINPLYIHRPVYSSEEVNKGASKHFRNLALFGGDVTDLMKESYTHLLVDQKARTLGDLLRWIADPANRPIAIHCTAGKDRTGVTIALLLSVLGVPDSTILADYSLTNLSFNRIYSLVKQDKETARLALFGLAVEDLMPLLTADPAVLGYTLAYIRRKYGSIESYLFTKAGLTPTLIDQLRAELLV